MKMLSLRSDTDCMVCGSCILECPQGCITFRLNDIITSGSKYRKDMRNTLLNTGVDKKRIFAIKE